MKAERLLNYTLHSCSVAAILLSIFIFPLAAQTAAAQAAPAPEKDTLVFNDGEKLIGQLRRSTGDSVVFHSDMAGDVTVNWSKIKELNSHGKFAVVAKGVNLRHEESAAKIPEGAVSVANNEVRLQPADSSPSVVLPLNQTADVIDAATFDKAVLRTPAWYERWKGSATVGLGVVKATQQSQNYTSAVSLVRAIPGEEWMNPENRTSFNFTSSYGELTQPNTPELKTSIFHAEAERDHYFSPRVYWFGEASFDHDYSQGLDLQQTFGSGIGWTVLKNAKEEFDVKTQLAFINQMFFDPTQNQKLLSSVFAESYNRKFPAKIMFHEDLSISPAWTNLNAYSATGNVNLTIPVVKRIAYTVGVLDTFLNNPSPGFRKNSFQFTSGITYVIP